MSVCTVGWINRAAMNHEKPLKPEAEKPPPPGVLNYTTQPINPVKPSKIRTIYWIVMTVLAVVVVIGFLNFIITLINFHG